jgi:hypothetical protein
MGAGVAPPAPPAGLEAFDRILRPLDGYAPDGDFYAVVQSFAGKADLSAEALTLRGWLQQHPGEPCDQRRVLNWLQQAARKQHRGEGQEGNGEPSKPRTKGNGVRYRSADLGGIAEYDELLRRQAKAQETG